MPDNNDAPQVLTVKQLREALAQFPDDLPVAVSVPAGDDWYDTYVVTEGPAYSTVDWGDGRGTVDDERYVGFDAFALLRPLTTGLEIVDVDSGASQMLKEN